MKIFSKNSFHKFGGASAIEASFIALDLHKLSFFASYPDDYLVVSSISSFSKADAKV